MLMIYPKKLLAVLPLRETEGSVLWFASDSGSAGGGGAGRHLCKLHGAGMVHDVNAAPPACGICSGGRRKPPVRVRSIRRKVRWAVVAWATPSWGRRPPSRKILPGAAAAGRRSSLRRPPQRQCCRCCGCCRPPWRRPLLPAGYLRPSGSSAPP